tara:strand:+ start:131 stop:892 length:762 start_codon:yes stop_codon:yes gene_type:complete
MNYFASPKNSDRAKRFREAYANATPGQDFMFEGQPYAGPPAPPSPNLLGGGLYDEEGPGTATGYRPIERINPNDQAYMSPEMLAESDAEEARMRLGERIGGRSKVMRDRPVWDHFEKRWVEPEGSFAQSPHGLDSLEDQGARDRWASDPYNAPRFAGANQMGTAEGFTHGMNGPGSDVTGMYAQSGGGGLLSEPMVDRDWLSNPRPTIQEAPSLLADNSNANKSGWEKDKPFNAALAQMIMQWSMNQATDDEF